VYEYSSVLPLDVWLTYPSAAFHHAGIRIQDLREKDKPCDILPLIHDQLSRDMMEKNLHEGGEAGGSYI
jgi:hypothetical protein